MVSDEGAPPTNAPETPFGNAILQFAGAIRWKRRPVRSKRPVCGSNRRRLPRCAPSCPWGEAPQFGPLAPHTVKGVCCAGNRRKKISINLSTKNSGFRAKRNAKERFGAALALTLIVARWKSRCLTRVEKTIPYVSSNVELIKSVASVSSYRNRHPFGVVRDLALPRAREFSVIFTPTEGDT